MEQTPPVVEPLNPAAAPAVEPTTEAAAPESAFSDELLQIPAMSALFAGQPAALSASIEDFSKGEEAKIIQDHAKELQKAGIGLYKALDGATGVLFNQLHLAGEDLKAADAAGKLLEVAPPFDQVNAAVGKSGSNHPALSAQVPTGAAVANAPAPGPMVPPPSAGAQKKVVAAREKNMQPTAPTGGSAPGQGRLLASILKPVL